jgi:lycopene beta-cyclase
MSYAMLLVAGLVVPVAVLAASVVWRAARRPGLTPGPRATAALLTVLLVVSAAYAIPWDNWMIQHGVFVYPPAKVAGWLGRVPVEDALLFTLQGVLATLWSVLVVTTTRPADVPPRAGRAVRVWSAVTVLAATVAAVVVRSPHTVYLTSILVWFGPPLVVQLAGAADVLLARWRQWLLALVPITVWLWAVEVVAIRQGIWWVDPGRSLAVRPAGIPVEDLLIFLVGNLFVVQTVLFAADPTMRSRARTWIAAARTPLRPLTRRYPSPGLD